MSDDEQAIRDLVTTWMEATKRGDFEAVLGLMTDDVVFLTAGREPFGKAVFEASAKAMGNVEIDGKSEILEVAVSGDLAYARSQLTVTAKMADGKVMERTGPVLTVYRRENGKWKLARDANLLTLKSAK